MPLQQAQWASFDNGCLEPLKDFPLKMQHSDAHAASLLRDKTLSKAFGADVICFPPGGEVRDHIHPMAHMLFNMHGEGTLTYEGASHLIFPGMCYHVPPNVVHGIKAGNNWLILLVVSNDHEPADSEERLEIVA